MDTTFDVGSDESPFFRFVAGEFHARGTPLRKQLANKTHAAAIARQLGLNSAAKYATLSAPDEFLDLTLPERFALKYAHGWSSRGIMLLETTGEPSRYFDHMSQRLLHADRIIDTQTRTSQSFPSKPDEWLVEQLLTGTTPGVIPFDYKFYTFRDVVGLIIQIDRNTSPVKVAIFDGEFNALRPGVDYLLSSSAQYGQHLLPKHPLQLLHWAALLSQATDSPFVSIDLFDTPDGPFFGEFTFSPGGLHKRMWTLSADVIKMLDQHFEQSPTIAVRPWAGNFEAHRLSSSELGRIEPSELACAEHVPSVLYENWSRYLYNGGRRGAVRMADFLADSSEPLRRPLRRRVAEHWAALPTVQASLNHKHL